MNFCSQCGAPVAQRVPPGDDRPRHVCDACNTVFYENPKIIAGCIPRWEDRVLLCRRAIEPRRGRWTVPAGFMENGETTPEAAARETLEEARARVEVGPLLCHIDIPRISQVYVIFLADLLEPVYAPGAESLEVDLFPEARIPWSELAFASVELALRLYFEDRRRGERRTHVREIRGPGPRPGAAG